jgi:diadenosine tetraphosphate (Ap4A) HIT family hydrolase
MNIDCILCQKYASRIFESHEFFVVYDDNPVRSGHLLIIPKQHVEDITLLTPDEALDYQVVLKAMVKHIKDEFGADGYNIGINCGEAAGQTIAHVHIHLIPRHFGDVADPHGGIRKFLPNPLTEYPPS